jgi:DNA-binding NtrC family response regulator
VSDTTERLEGARRLVGDSAPMKKLRDRLQQVAKTPLPVLLLGETGSGKEVAARALHEMSGRRGQFVAVDCGALSPQLVETELFGHERGAFTGANQRREGLVWAAQNGTFFLDEIGELPMPAQTRLLRLLQEGTYRPVGGNDERRADIRVVAATWRDLQAYVAEGRFRRDLYHRLAVVELKMPALRERPADVPVLVQHFLEDGARESGRAPPRLDAALKRHLEAWPWPGNVRELRNVASWLAAMSRGPTAGLEDLPPQHRRPPPGLPDPSAAGAIADVRIDMPYMEARRLWLDAFQQRYVEALLDAHGGNVSQAARAAGMDRRSIQRIAARKRVLLQGGQD